MAFQSFLLLLCLLSLLPFVHCRGSFGPCPSTPSIPSLEVYRYLGTWFEIIRSRDIPFELGDCVQAHYSLRADGRLNVTNSEVRSEGLAFAYGTGYCDSDGSGICSISFSPLLPDGHLQIISTDYTQYAVVLSCTSIYLYHWTWVWLLSRTPTLDHSFEAYLKETGVEEEDWRYTNQQNCPQRQY